MTGSRVSFGELKAWVTGAGFVLVEDPEVVGAALVELGCDDGVGGEEGTQSGEVLHGFLRSEERGGAWVRWSQHVGSGELVGRDRVMGGEVGDAAKTELPARSTWVGGHSFVVSGCRVVDLAGAEQHRRAAPGRLREGLRWHVGGGKSFG